MEGKIIGDQSQTVQYFLQGIGYFEENVLPKKQRLVKQLRAMRDKRNTQDKDRIIYVISTRKSSLKWLKMQMERMNEDKKITIIVLDYFKESTITTQYIKAYLDRGKNEAKALDFICIEFSEHDYITQLEDEYSQTFSYKSLSRYYRKKLQQIALQRLSLIDDEVLEAYYASRYMV